MSIPLFSIVQNLIIYLTCTKVISVMAPPSGGFYDFVPTSGRIAEIVQGLSRRKRINNLISNCKWEILFAHQDWLELLKEAQRINNEQDGLLTRELERLKQCFPEQTKDFLL